MFQESYTVGSRMITQQRRKELLANNLSNAPIPRVKEDCATLCSFTEMFLARLDEQSLLTQHPLHPGGEHY